MAEILKFPEKRRFLADLSPDEREFAENLLRYSPNYRYEVSGMPKLDPPPAPGPASAAAAVKAMMAWIKPRRFD
jgi:hypothetical protein